MSLRLWFPFTQNMLNYGESESNVVTNSNVTLNASGKLGKCGSFNGSSSYLIGTQNFLSNNTSEWSFACWMKLNATTAGQTLFSCRTAVSQNGFAVLYYGTTWIVDDGARWQPTASLSKDTWYHICVVYKKGVGKYIYINGVLDKSTTTTGTPTIVSTTHYAIGATQNTATTSSGNFMNGYLNDVRFYDHAISQAEIKELSKGLAVHYKLDDMFSSDNLIVNGFGELGTENWNTASYISTTEIPPNHPEIKSSVYNGNSTKEYIPIIKNHSYTVSGYIKQQGTATTSTYPSLLAYDIDKKQIQCHQTKDGFAKSEYMTTLSQPLHKGDTVIHATDLSAWTTADTNYYFHVAIFGYKDSRGYVYPDMFYTQDSPSFGSKTNKSNIDKTNNTITLLSAFTGEDRPAGTTICQATEGATYYYPWGGINPSTVTNWTFKTKTFKPNTVNRFKAASYIRWSTYGRLYVAGSKLVDNTACNSKITDSSGYGNHAIRNGNTSISYNTPRYDISTVFDGTSSYIESDPLPAETKTISIWLKTSWVSSSGYRLAVHDKNTGLAIGWSSNQLITYVGTSNGGSGSRIDITTTNYTANQWNHIVVVKTGSNTRNVYVNGVLATPSSVNYWGGDLTKLNIGVRHINGSYSAYFNGQLSDFRAYATALSAEDVLELYHTAAKVSNKNEMLCYEMRED